MRTMQESIKKDNFPTFIKDFFKMQFPNEDYPQWAIDALDSVNVNLLTEQRNSTNRHELKSKSNCGKDSNVEAVIKGSEVDTT